jgi:tetratricopeptide (TPR) repeat protein
MTNQQPFVETRPVVDIRRAYAWLRMRDERQQQVERQNNPNRPDMMAGLEPSFETLRNQLDDAIQKLDHARVERTINRLSKIGLSPKDANALVYNERLFGRIYLHCALAYYDMGHLSHAKKYFAAAIEKYKGNAWFEEAMARWMRGYVHWQLLDEHDDATLDWQHCIGVLRQQQRNYVNDDILENCLNEMQASLRTCILQDGLPKQNITMLPFWPVYETIAPHTQDLRDLPADQLRRVQTNQFWIDNRPYILEISGSVPMCIPDDQVKVVRVEDDTMQDAALFTGDYILLQPPPPTPVNDQLVLVRIYDQQRIVIRYHFRRDESVEFRERRTQPSRTPFRAGGPDYTILGEVIGVFRPTRSSQT